MKSTVKTGLTVAAAVLGVWLLWQWGFCRFYVGPDQMAVITAKMGKELPPGQILAQKGQQGILEEVLGEGRHFLNPWFYEREIRPVISIPPGKVGIVPSKVGEELPEGDGPLMCTEDGTLYRGPIPQEPALPPDPMEEIKILKQQVKAASDQNEFLEDCIAEMAEIVYA